MNWTNDSARTLSLNAVGAITTSLTESWRLPSQQCHARGNETGGNPAPLVNSFMQKDFRGDGSRLKKATAMAATPKRKLGLPSVRPITIPKPARRQSAPTSPTCFIARARSTSPITEAKTIARIAFQV
jgi:hypothetical protein